MSLRSIARMLTIGFVALSLAVPAAVLAFPGGGGNGYGRGPGAAHGPMGPGFLKFIGDLDLTAEQQAAFETLQQETSQKIEPPRMELQALNVPAVLLAEIIDVAAAETVLEKAAALRGQIMEIKHDAMLAGAQILTPEQRAQLLESISARKAKRGGGNKRGRCMW